MPLAKEGRYGYRFCAIIVSLEYFAPTRCSLIYEKPNKSPRISVNALAD